MARAALTLSLLLALPAAAAADGEEPAVPRVRAKDAPLQAWLVPALEVEMVHLSFLAFSNLVTGRDFALVSFDTIASHFDGRKPWHFDEDYFHTNMLGHPYQGALSFTAARSSGLSFWAAAIYAAIGSLTWELFYEVDAPSINDQITTTLGGTFLGEVLHRSALLIWHDETLPKPARAISEVLLEPLGAFNRWLFDSSIDESDAWTESAFALVSAGASIVSRRVDTAAGVETQSDGANVDAQAWFTYGVFDPRAPPARGPFSHFDLVVGVTPDHLPLGNLFMRGILVGREMGLGNPRLLGAWGLFGQYDYLLRSMMRVSSIGFGPGATFQWHFSKHGYLQGSALASVSPFSSIGNLALDAEQFRDYHIGPGFSALVELRLINSEVAMLRGVARQWLVLGAYAPPTGYEVMTDLTLGVVVKLGWHIGAAAEVDAAVRVPKFLDDTFNRWVRDSVVRVSLCYLSDESFGVFAPIREAPSPP